MPTTINHRLQYNVTVDMEALRPHTDTLDGVSPDVTFLRFRREKNSHRGISKLTQLRTLLIFCANQESLEEISTLPSLETLYVSETNATNLDCLGKCRTLRHLIIDSGTKITSLEWLALLPPLESLLLVNFKRITDLSGIGAQSTLKAFGFEGSMWTTTQVENFEPIADLKSLKALFLTNCRPASKSLVPLQKLSGLKYLEIAAFYPDSEFLALRRALPQLKCGWFEAIDQYGSIQASIKARTQDK